MLLTICSKLSDYFTLRETVVKSRRRTQERQLNLSWQKWDFYILERAIRRSKSWRFFTYAARATVTIQVLETLSLSARHGTPSHLYTAQRYVCLVTGICASANNVGLSDFEVHPAQNFRRRGPQDVLLQDGVRCFAIHLWLNSNRI